MSANDPVARYTREAGCIVRPKTTLRGVIDELAETGEALAVVLDGQSIGGVVSEGDIVRAIHDGADLDEVWAADVMTESLMTVHAEAPIRAAVDAMLEAQLRYLFVVTGDEVRVVTLADALRAVLA